MMRIGHGFDVHRLVAGRPLMLGGVQIPHEYGLLGHSDADVLLHAVADAILGALALGDIGRHFPDSDPAYKDADSMLLLKDVIALAESHGYRVGNLDTTIVAQQPKLLPYLEQMVNNLARVCKVSSKNINVKATTTEELGYTGRGEGISTHAVVLMTAVG